MPTRLPRRRLLLALASALTLVVVVLLRGSIKERATSSPVGDFEPSTRSAAMLAAVEEPARESRAGQVEASAGLERLPDPSARGRADRHRFQVVGADGAPLGRAFVRGRYELVGASAQAAALDSGGGAAQRVGTRRADAEGRVELPRWSGSAVLSGDEIALELVATFKGAELNARVADGRLGERGGQEFGAVVFRPLGQGLAGRVLDGCGTGIAGARVEVWWTRTEGERSAGVVPERVADTVTFADAAGQFEVLGEQDEVRWVRVWHAVGDEQATQRLVPGVEFAQISLIRARGIVGRLQLPVEVGDLEVRLMASSISGAASLRSPLVSRSAVRSGRCFELQAPIGESIVLLDGRFPACGVQMRTEGRVDVGTLDLSTWVPLRLTVVGPSGELQRVRLRSVTQHHAWEVPLDLERRMVLPPEAFPLRVMGAFGQAALLEAEGPYERRIELESAIEVPLRLELPESLQNVEQYSLILRTIETLGKDPLFRGTVQVRGLNAWARVPYEGEYTVELVLNGLWRDPDEFEIQPLEHPVSRSTRRFNTEPPLLVSLGSLRAERGVERSEPVVLRLDQAQVDGVTGR